MDSSGKISAHGRGSAEIIITDTSGNRASLTVNVKRWSSLNDYFVIAHRGASGHRRENSLSAFRYAHTLGAEMIELDVRKTKDGSIVCHHDSTISNGKKDYKISDLTLSQLRSINGDICTLRQALECISQLDGIQLQIEFKDYGITERVVELVRETGMENRTCYGAFMIGVLNKVKELDPSTRTVYIMNSYSTITDVARNPDKYNVDVVSVSVKHLSENLVAQYHLAGRQVYGWTVNSKNEINACINLGVDGVITNYPDRA